MVEDPTTAQAQALDALRARIRAVSAPPLPDAVRPLLDALNKRYPGAAILFYGSGASVARHDDPSSLIFDFYVIGETYEALYASTTLRTLGRLLPPNVFYVEAPSPHGLLRAKAAVLTIDHFEKLVSEKTFHSYFWGRFAQPCRIECPSPDLKTRLEAALATSIATFCKRSAGLLGAAFIPCDLWLAGLGASYKAELRAEDETRAAKLIESYGDWAQDVTAPALILAGLTPQTDGGRITLAKPAPRTGFSWRLRSLQGAFLSAARLLKATQTFKGGIDYIAWKIKRHSGIDLRITDWERNHPMLGAPGAALRYYRLRGQQKRNPKSAPDLS